MKFGVVVFPGSNCDHDTLYVIREKLKQEVVALWHKDTDLQACDFIILPGGFSYGDYLRSGAVARFSPIMESVINFAKNGGYVLGICNGFQVLCEAHLLPGVLMHNESRKFICRNTFIRTETTDSLLTSGLQKKEVLKIPIAHAEGKYYLDSSGLSELKKHDQILFRYSDRSGNLDRVTNPNGSIEHIAGICNKERNIFGMMPHPERASDKILGNTDGLKLLKATLSLIAS